MEPQASTEPAAEAPAAESKTLKWALYTEQNEARQLKITILCAQIPLSVSAGMKRPFFIFSLRILTLAAHMQKWRAAGSKVILGQYDHDSIVVYQWCGETKTRSRLFLVFWFLY